MKKKGKYPNLYLAVGLCLLAMTVGAAVDARVSRAQKAAEETATFTRITASWTAQPTNAAAVPATDVADPRETEAAATVAPNKPYSGDFQLPMGSDIHKPFSGDEPVYSETMGDWRVHNGTDFAGSVGNDVHAVAAGRVQRVYDDSFWGTVMEIDHGNGLTLRYCGLQSGSCLPEGSTVEKGARIAALGHIPIEMETDHLHLEALIDGEYVDPLAALNKGNTAE
ncbi:MAG: M23 family metallopeptidase [Clostridia bacterium]|nr:M23 family metallopeptidase [Clostridia bacterium]